MTRRAVQLALFYAMLLWLGSMLLVGSLLVAPLVILPGVWRRHFVQARISATVRLFLRGCALCGLMRLDLEDLDQLNGVKRGFIIAANHPSMIDVFLVLSRVKHAVCLMKSSIGGNLFLATGARLAGYISNARNDLLLRHAAQAVRQGECLLVFPEGTRTISEHLNQLKPGVGLIAKRASAPIQLVILQTNSHYLAKGWRIWRPPQFPLVYRARLGALLQPSDDVHANVNAIREGFERELYGQRPIDPALSWKTS